MTRPSTRARTRPSTEGTGAARRLPAPRLRVAVRDALVVVDDLGDDEVQERLGEHRVEAGAVGERPQPSDLPLLAQRVGGGQVLLGLEPADLLGALEALRQEMDERCIDV